MRKDICDICGADATAAKARTGFTFNIGLEEFDTDAAEGELIDVCDDCGLFITTNAAVLDQLLKGMRESFLRTMSAYRSKVPQ